jgi:hypothetical protein
MFSSHSGAKFQAQTEKYAVLTEGLSNKQTKQQTNKYHGTDSPLTC